MHTTITIEELISIIDKDWIGHALTTESHRETMRDCFVVIGKKALAAKPIKDPSTGGPIDAETGKRINPRQDFIDFFISFLKEFYLESYTLNLWKNGYRVIDNNKIKIQTYKNTKMKAENILKSLGQIRGNTLYDNLMSIALESAKEKNNSNKTESKLVPSPVYTGESSQVLFQPAPAAASENPGKKTRSIVVVKRRNGPR